MTLKYKNKNLFMITLRFSEQDQDPETEVFYFLKTDPPLLKILFPSDDRYSCAESKFYSLKIAGNWNK